MMHECKRLLNHSTAAEGLLLARTSAQRTKVGCTLVEAFCIDDNEKRKKRLEHLELTRTGLRLGTWAREYLRLGTKTKKGAQVDNPLACLSPGG